MNAFSFDTVADDFDSHISYSIPGYDELIHTVLQLAPSFIQSAGRVYDLGCSTGALLKTIDQLHPDIELVGYDNEPAFQQQWHRHYLHCDDIRYADISLASLVFSLFTFQFLAPVDVPVMIHRIYSALLPGGALIVAEKTHFETGHVQDLTTTIYHNGKRDHFSDSEILDKSAALFPAMRLNTSGNMRRMLEDAGFTMVEPIWQRLHFRAWLAIKE